jgi:hypothetical protein
MTLEEIEKLFDETYQKEPEHYLRACMLLQSKKAEYMESDFYKSTGLPIEEAYERCLHDDYMYALLASMLNDAVVNLHLDDKVKDSGYDIQNLLSQLSDKDRSFIEEIMKEQKITADK